ncbi:MAG: hypothetical protein M1828_002707 [Chrysothrix sp. TS-e1954]|nr:MAG: hypothetical protein M1828_002707 [Chrysothrix sp. TS-e1954]
MAKRNAASQITKDSNHESSEDSDRPQIASGEVMKGRKILDTRRRRIGGHRAGPGVESLGNIFGNPSQGPPMNGNQGAAPAGNQNHNQQPQPNFFSQSISQSFPPPNQSNFNSPSSVSSSFPPAQSGSGFVFGSGSQPQTSGFNFGVNNSSTNPFSQGLQAPQTPQIQSTNFFGTLNNNNQPIGSNTNMPSQPTFGGFGGIPSQQNDTVNGFGPPDSTPPDGMQISPPETPEKQGLGSLSGNGTAPPAFGKVQNMFGQAQTQSTPQSQPHAAPSKAPMFGSLSNGQTGVNGATPSTPFTFSQATAAASSSQPKPSTNLFPAPSAPATQPKPAASFSFGQPTQNQPSLFPSSTPNQSTNLFPSNNANASALPSPEKRLNGNAGSNALSQSPFSPQKQDTTIKNGAQSFTNGVTKPSSQATSASPSESNAPTQPHVSLPASTELQTSTQTTDMSSSGLTTEQQQHYKRLRRLTALNTSFRNALQTLDAAHDWGDMMHAYICERDRVLSTDGTMAAATSEAVSKRKADDVLAEGEARRQGGNAPSSTQQNSFNAGHSASKTVNMFQSIIDNPTKSAASPTPARGLFSPTQPGLPAANVAKPQTTANLFGNPPSKESDQISSTPQKSVPNFGSPQSTVQQTAATPSGFKVSSFGQPSHSAALPTSTGFQPSIFAQQSDTSSRPNFAQEEAKPKRKADGFDSEKDNIENLEDDAEAQKQKKTRVAKSAASAEEVQFVPGHGFDRSQASSNASPVFGSATTKAPATNNIFGHLGHTNSTTPKGDEPPDQDSDAEADAGDDEADSLQEDKSESQATSAASLSSRITAGPNAASNSSLSDNTWKADSPIKFGAQTPSNGAPQSGNTLFPATNSTDTASPAKNGPSLFKSPPAFGGSSTFGSNLFSPKGPSSTPLFGNTPNLGSSLFSPKNAGNDTPKKSTPFGLDGAQDSEADVTSDAPSNRSPSKSPERESSMPEPESSVTGEELLFEARDASIIRQFTKDERAKAAEEAAEGETPKTYAAHGRVVIRVLRNNETGKSRIICRAANKLGKLHLNTVFLPNVSYEKMGARKNKVTIPAVKMHMPGIEMWIATLQEEQATELSELCESLKGSMSK